MSLRYGNLATSVTGPADLAADVVTAKSTSPGTVDLVGAKNLELPGRSKGVSMSGNDGTERDDSADLLRRVREGDEQAAHELCDRFLRRLIGLARKKLPTQMTRRVDPEDVVEHL